MLSVSPAPAAAAKPEMARRRVAQEKSLAENSDGLADSAASQPALTPEERAKQRLAEPLRDLAAKVEKQGQSGNYSEGKIKVANYRLAVMLYLRDLSADTLAALKKLGFEQSGDSKTVKLLIGTIDVRKLDELSKLEAILRIDPVPG